VTIPCHEYAVPAPGAAPVALSDAEALWQSGQFGLGDIIVLTEPLSEAEWDLLRAFVRKTSRESLRGRFGQAADFTDDQTLKRLFAIKGRRGEMICMVEEGGAVCGIVHLVELSPTHAEIALIVRSDRARRGIGEKLLRVALGHAARRHLNRLSAFVLHENIPMLRLARKVGFAPCKSLGLTVELEFDLDRIHCGPEDVASASRTATIGAIGAVPR
jgi:RimJ/RimL family protein N-acetyltransferase